MGRGGCSTDLISRCPDGRAARPHQGANAGGTAPPTWHTAPCPPAPGRPCPRGAAGTGVPSTGATSARCRGSSPPGLSGRHSFSPGVCLKALPRGVPSALMEPPWESMFSRNGLQARQRLEGFCGGGYPRREEMRGRIQGPESKHGSGQGSLELLYLHLTWTSAPPTPPQPLQRALWGAPALEGTVTRYQRHPSFFLSQIPLACRKPSKDQRKTQPGIGPTRRRGGIKTQRGLLPRVQHPTKGWPSGHRSAHVLRGQRAGQGVQTGPRPAGWGRL